MTYRNQIWRRANESSESRCIEILKKLFPSLSYQFTVTDSGVVRNNIETKPAALKKIRLGLNKITEVEAQYYISVLDQKKRSSQIKY